MTSYRQKDGTGYAVAFVQHPIILLAVLTTRASRALFLTERFPYQVTMLKERTLSKRQRYTDYIDTQTQGHGS